VSPTLQGLEGNAPTCTLRAGALPPGVSLNGATCALSGAATQAGQYSFTVRLTAAGVTGSIDAATTVEVTDPTPTLAVANPSPYGLADFSMATLFDFGHRSLVALASYNAQPGDVVTYAISSGSLPPGLTLNAADGSASGTTTGYGKYSVDVVGTLSRRGISYTTAAVTVTFDVSTGLLLVQYPMTCSVPIGTELMCGPPTSNFVPFPGASLTYSASGLPTGVSIDPASGTVDGIALTDSLTATELLSDGSSKLSSIQLTLQARLPYPSYSWRSGTTGTAIGTPHPTGAGETVSLSPGIPFRLPMWVASPLGGDVYSFALLPLNGSTPLPSWVAIDATTGDIFGTPPSGSGTVYWVVQMTTVRLGQQYVTPVMFVASYQ